MIYLDLFKCNSNVSWFMIIMNQYEITNSHQILNWNDFNDWIDIRWTAVNRVTYRLVPQWTRHVHTRLTAITTPSSTPDPEAATPVTTGSMGVIHPAGAAITALSATFTPVVVIIANTITDLVPVPFPGLIIPENNQHQQHLWKKKIKKKKKSLKNITFQRQRNDTNKQEN